MSQPKKRKINPTSCSSETIISEEPFTFELIDFDHQPCPPLIHQLRHPLPMKKAFSNNFHHTKTITIPIHHEDVDYFNMHILRGQANYQNVRDGEILCLLTDGSQVLFCNVESGQVMNCVRFDFFAYSLILEERRDGSLFAILSNNDGVALYDLSRFVVNENGHEIVKHEDCLWMTSMKDALSLSLIYNEHPILNHLIGKEKGQQMKLQGNNLIVVGTTNGFKFLNSLNGSLIHQIDYKTTTETENQSSYLVGISHNPFSLTFVCTFINVESNFIGFYMFDSTNDWIAPTTVKHVCHPLCMDYDSISQNIYLCTSDAIHVLSRHGQELLQINTITNIQSIFIDNHSGACYVACGSENRDEPFMKIKIFS